MAEKRNSAAVTNSSEEFTLVRAFDAPCELVWKAWTDAERLAKWWGPKGFTWTHSKMDLRMGGVFHYGLRAPDGLEMWGKFVFHEIVKPERLSFVVSFSDKKGGTTRHPLSAQWPLEVLNTTIFTEHRGQTTVSISGIPVNANEIERKAFKDGHKNMESGFTGTLDQLEAYLEQTVG